MTTTANFFQITATLEDVCYPDDFQGVELDKYSVLISAPVDVSTAVETLKYDLVTAAISSSDRNVPRTISDEQVEKAISTELKEAGLKYYFCEDEDHEGEYIAYMTLAWDYDTCIEYSVPQFLLSAIVNADTTGITDEDEKCLDAFLKSAEADMKSSFPKCTHVSWVFAEEGEIDFNHDVTGIGAAKCVEAKCVAHL